MSSVLDRDFYENILVLSLKTCLTKINWVDVQEAMPNKRASAHLLTPSHSTSNLHPNLPNNPHQSWKPDIAGIIFNREIYISVVPHFEASYSNVKLCFLRNSWIMVPRLNASNSSSYCSLSAVPRFPNWSSKWAEKGLVSYLIFRCSSNYCCQVFLPSQDT